MDLGRSLAPVTDDYTGPFEYAGRIDRVVFELPARRSESDAKAEAEAAGRAAMTRQ